MVLFAQVEFHMGKLKIRLLVQTGKLSSNLKLYTDFVCQALKQISVQTKCKSAID